MALQSHVRAFLGGFEVVNSDDDVVICRFCGPEAKEHANKLVIELDEITKDFNLNHDSDWMDKDCPF